VTDVVIVVPVLRRPHRAAPLVESVAAATPEPHRVLFVASPDDLAEQEAVKHAGADLLVVDRPAGPGDYARKINAGVRATNEPLILFGADDLHFHPDWLPEAAAFLNDRTLVVGTNDLGNRRVLAGKHSTHPLVARSYIEQHGTIDGPGVALHEGYHHNWVDNEFCATAQRRRVWAFARRSVVEHLHPSWEKAPDDAVYRLGRRSFERDREYFRERRRLWT
jgi:glycosyltransferase involved in cell wall biosynthesis